MAFPMTMLMSNIVSTTDKLSTATPCFTKETDQVIRDVGRWGRIKVSHLTERM